MTFMTIQPQMAAAAADVARIGSAISEANAAAICGWIVMNVIGRA